jgi:nitric oxide reductase NorD protein
MEDDDLKGKPESSPDRSFLPTGEQEKLRSTERQSFLELTREMARLPLDQAAAALETSAAIAGVSLRAGIEFLRAVPAAAQVLHPPELRSWGEMGRGLAMNDVETSISFFSAGVGQLKTLMPEAQALLFQLCSRQLSLANAVANETFRGIGEIVASIGDPDLVRSVLEIAAEIARRSARHSAEFLSCSRTVVEALKQFNDPDLIKSALTLTASFASRAGGIAADAWANLPTAISSLDTTAAKTLLDRTEEFLGRGGGVAFHVMLTGGELLRSVPAVFADWIELLWTVAAHGNASLVAFVRSTPRFIAGLSADVDHSRALQLSRRVLKLTREIAKLDSEAALACFRSSARALRSVSIEQFEEWARQGLKSISSDVRARRSYFALQTRGSYEALHSGSNGLSLEIVQPLLRLYVEALTGRDVDIVPLAAVPDESRIGDGKTIYLPSMINEFGDAELDFRLYKVLAAHAGGQIEFGTHERGSAALYAAYADLSARFNPANADARDAFALDGYLAPDDIIDPREVTLPPGADYRSVLSLFPDPQIARRIFGTLENCRIDRRLRQKYRGLVRDLDLIRQHLRRSRPRITELPTTMIPFELLFQITLLGGALDDSRQYYGQVVSELETVVVEYFQVSTASVADTLMATARVYSLFQSVTPTDDSVKQVETPEEPSDEESATAVETMKQRQTERMPRRRDARELFNAWNEPNADGEPDQINGTEAWIEAEMPEQALAEGEVAYNYDEWDRELTDHRLGWCRVVEKSVKHGDRSFVDQTRERHKGAISSIRYQFQLMRPENLIRVANELDGEDYDLNAVIDYVIDRRADGQQSERLYTKRLRRRRDVAVSFLLDQSSSTARTIGRHPLQPYTRPGQRIIEIEKEGLVLMSEALEAVGDIYSINGFTSEGRRNVKFYIVKDFDEKYTDDVKRRIGGISYQNNTRLGAAIRHATSRLARQDARTRLLIVLSDGRPYDHDYGDARYAREDTREALRQAKNSGITPFCITIDRESEAELRDLYGEIGYTIIDDVLSLPERLPGIYRRLTT